MVLVPGATVRVHDKVRDLGLARNTMRTQAWSYPPCTTAWTCERVAKRAWYVAAERGSCIAVLFGHFLRYLLGDETQQLGRFEVARAVMIVIHLFSSLFRSGFPKGAVHIRIRPDMYS